MTPPLTSAFGLLRRRWLVLLGITPVALGCERGSYEFEACDASADESGLAMCEGGYVHRPQAVTCSEAGPAIGGACTEDAHCMGAAYCLCTEDGGQCMQSVCRSDDECEEGYVCASVEGTQTLACQTPDDECMFTEDCGDDGFCAFDGTSRVCQYPTGNPLNQVDWMQRDDCNGGCCGCTDGRPFIVQGANRRAELTSRSEWLAAYEPTTSMPESERLALSEHWSAVGLMEHASIAAFARLALQLLALGAPPELVDRATRAASDEIRHAMFAFKLASVYGGTKVGPAPLAIDGALDGTDLATLVRLAIREGCVGETAAALVVREGASRCEDERLQRELEAIADDELEHADLAWATLAWALRVDRALTVRVISEEIALLAREKPAAPSGDEPLARHGVLSDQRFGELRAEAIRQVVAPILRGVAGPPPDMARAQAASLSR